MSSRISGVTSKNSLTALFTSFDCVI
jgi:hypothetical protein